MVGQRRQQGASAPDVSRYRSWKVTIATALDKLSVTFAKGLLVAFLIVLATMVIAGPAGSVVGGSAIPVESAPWAVALSLKGAIEPVECSGVIIDRLHILTAAHCLYDGITLIRPSQILVRAGAANVATPSRDVSLQRRSVLSFRVHPAQQSGADVAVLRLTRPLKLDGKHAEAIALDKRETWRGGAGELLSAFGREDPNLLPTGALRQIGVAVSPQGTCGDEGLTGYGAALLLCASSPFGAACHGDSGGGLVSSGAHPTLVGIETSDEGQHPCKAGELNGYVYVGAPEVWRFIDGDAHPPLAPQTFSLKSWGLPVHVGDQVPCDGLGAGKSTTHYVLSVDGRPRRSGSHGFSYTVTAVDLGKRVLCRGSATNAGGTSAQWWETSPVKP